MVHAGVVALLCVCLSVCAALICPDGGMCEDENTCCLTPSGGYGCCPLPNAECCSDHLHCCYQGTLCDLVHSKCVNKTHTLDWVEKIATKPHAVICPDQESECPDDTTCCQMPDGSWGCCPMKDAVCCEDKRHCCPQGTKCDLEHSMCVSATYGPSPLWRKFAARRRKPLKRTAVAPPKDSGDVGDVICPDEISTCPDDTTCCKLDTGSYGCCPMPNAVCCSDHLHCCPEATTCDIVHSMCVSADGIMVKMATKIPATSLKPEEKLIPCNETVACESGTTCCKTQKGTWACCPLPEAVCCEDHIHCCPQDTVCNVAAGSCDNPADLSVSVPWLAKVPTFAIAPSSQKCDETYACPDGSTCCRLPSGKFGCCPLPQAVCCEDHLHCCPHDTVCNLAASSCDSTSDQGPRFSVPLVKKVPAMTLPSQSQNCDETSLCPTGTTCCRLSSGSWACCPMPQAVCCSDHLHCCPEATTCDIVHSMCVSADGIMVKMATKIPATSLKPEEKLVPCNETVACESGTTCCKTQKGTWACCPLPEAVCCEDHIHCCPQDTVCNVAAGSCDNPADLSVSVPWVAKVPTFAIAPSNEKCDETYACPDGSTCCRLPSGKFSCCPLPQAVCCEDHLHCCPHDTVCNLAASSCDSTSDQGPRFSVPLVKKVPAMTLPSQSQNCDETSLCPTGTTCCRLSSGSWACCPMPQGYKCDLTHNTCERPGLPSMPLFRKQSALKLSDDHATVDRNMCDDKTSCPEDDTCCFMNNLGKWGCCPLPKAVCCKNGNHCCPKGYTCNEEKTSCTKAYHEIPWYTKQEAKVVMGSEVQLGDEDVKCDSTTSCAAGSTCCKLPTGQWGCCPLVKAVCCEDHEHCCPQGYTCNLEFGTCVKASSLHSVPLTQLQTQTDGRSEEEVLCDASTHCSNTQSCCRLSDSTWACCPYKEAVCCEDMQHCCPMGYKCDPQVQGCTKASTSTWWENSL